jgi:hypothetical protein
MMIMQMNRQSKQKYRKKKERKVEQAIAVELIIEIK